MKNNLVGTIDKIRVIKSFPERLVRFTLLTKDGSVNCIAKTPEADKLMLLINEKNDAAVFGHYNNRNQLIIEKLSIRNPSSFIVEYSKFIERKVPV